MKKLMTFAACAMLAAVTHAATVGWSLAGANNYAGDAYNFFVIGQNGVGSIATVTALLDAGESVSSYTFGSGLVNASGLANQAATAAGAPSLDAGTYTGFYVLFDDATPTAGSSKYAVVSGAANLTKTFAATAATVQFVAGNQSTFLADTNNWKSFGATSDVPEPTSGLLMLLGVAGLALKRKRA